MSRVQALIDDFRRRTGGSVSYDAMFIAELLLGSGRTHPTMSPRQLKDSLSHCGVASLKQVEFVFAMGTVERVDVRRFVDACCADPTPANFEAARAYVHAAAHKCVDGTGQRAITHTASYALGAVITALELLT